MSLLGHGRPWLRLTKIVCSVGSEFIEKNAFRDFWDIFKIYSNTIFSTLNIFKLYENLKDGKSCSTLAFLGMKL